MQEDPLKTMTTFDSILQSRQLQMMKAAIPYMPKKTQKMFSVFTKYFELIKTIEMNHKEDSALSMCSITTENSKVKLLSLLQEIRPYCNKTENETIDLIVDVFQMVEAYESMLD